MGSQFLTEVKAFHETYLDLDSIPKSGFNADKETFKEVPSLFLDGQP